MHVTFVHIQTVEAMSAAFIEATQLNHEASLQEPGCRRFDLLQSPLDPNRFMLYEAYINAEAAAAHKLTAHYLAWRSTVEPMMAKARSSESWHGLLPNESTPASM